MNHDHDTGEVDDLGVDGSIDRDATSGGLAQSLHLLPAAFA